MIGNFNQQARIANKMNKPTFNAASIPNRDCDPIRKLSPQTE